MNSRQFFSLLFLLVPYFFLSGQILVGPVIGGQGGIIVFDDKSVKDLYTVKPFMGFHAGGSISFRIKNSFFLQTSILYSRKGKRMEGKQDQLFKNVVRYHYMDMPILFTKELKGKFGKDRYFKIHLGAGPNVGYWLGGKGLLKNSDLNENGYNPPNYDLPYHITFGKDPMAIIPGEMNIEKPNRIQLGLNFSCGLIFEPVGFNKFMVTARLELGHSFLSSDSKGEFGLPGKLFYADDLRIRNQEMALSIFYFIDLKTEDRKKGKSTLKSKGK